MTDAAYTTPPVQARADPLRGQGVGQQTPHYARDAPRCVGSSGERADAGSEVGGWKSFSLKSKGEVHTYSDAISAARLIYRSVAQLLSTIFGGRGLLRTCSAHTDPGLCSRSRRKNHHKESDEIGLQLAGVSTRHEILIEL